MRRRTLHSLAAGAVFAVAMYAATNIRLRAAESEQNSYRWNLPKGFPIPYVPADNPMSEAKVELGRYLFYDARLSVNGKQSCASCHKQELAFTDGRAVGIGATGESHSRGAMSLVNVAWSGALTWNNPTMKNLEEQALVPMFGEHPIELGLRRDGGFAQWARSDAIYLDLFPYAFPDAGDPYTIPNVTKALACFERNIVSARSAYDRYHYGGDDSAVSESAKRGEVLFFDQRLSCFRCHGGFNFTDSTVSERNPNRTLEFHNTGLYNAPGLYSYPPPNVGIFEYTKAPEDVGKFKAPTLRNIAVTAPYMHDGSIPTLEGVIEHYAAGGKNGHDNPNKDPLIAGFTISAQGKADLIAFLQSLTDAAVLHDARFGDPWRRE
ncbi:MAG TPA: di-heme enzyme [Bryobacteraceae bacterium]|nr:di-heme enzyme [Bryobacteraceae bacterium]